MTQNIVAARSIETLIEKMVALPEVFTAEAREVFVAHATDVPASLNALHLIVDTYTTEDAYDVLPEVDMLIDAEGRSGSDFRLDVPMYAEFAFYGTDRGVRIRNIVDNDGVHDGFLLSLDDTVDSKYLTGVRVWPSDIVRGFASTGLTVVVEAMEALRREANDLVARTRP